MVVGRIRGATERESIAREMKRAVASLAKCNEDETRKRKTERTRREQLLRWRERDARERDENGAERAAEATWQQKKSARSEKSGGRVARQGSEDEGKKPWNRRWRERDGCWSRVEAAGFLSRHRRRHPTKIDPVRVLPVLAENGRVSVCAHGVPAVP